ncbi:MAG: sugar transferase, partial [Acidobacteriota bacterium]
PDTVEPFCRGLAAPPAAPGKPVEGASVALDDIPRAIEDAGASIVILAGGHEHQEAMAPALARLHFSGVPVVAAAEVWAWLEERLPLEALTPGLFLHQPGFGAVHWTLFNRVTRIVDVVASLGLMVILSPVFLLALVAIRLFQGAPVFYRQERVGQYGRTFTLYKLRTMRRDAERDSGPTFAARADRRVTPVGAFLRRFRIDEMPQLWNILKGEMSLVGPRPERPTFVAELSEALPFYSFRLAVPPGLSGWAQVNHPYAANLEDHRRKLEFDLYFIRERSMRLYLLTLLRTVSAMLVGARTRPRKPSLSPSVEHRPVAPARSSS